MKKSLLTSTGILLSLGSLILTGCTDNGSSASSDGKVSVSSTDNECKLSTNTVKAGKNVFSVKNEGSKVTEFYILASDGVRIIAELENIGPGITRDLTTELAQGSYKVTCKPGMVGDGISGTLTVDANPHATAISADEKALRDTAVSQYTAYVKSQTEELKSKTEEFAAAYESGDFDKARTLYPQARLHYERIEPVAESFGDLDPQLDAREADLKDGEKWSGWHMIEKDLWQPKPEDNKGKTYVPLTADQRKAVAEQLKTDTQSLYDKTRNLDLKVDELANGAKELLDEVGKSKVTGEEEVWSHTDLSDFQGNIDGARVVFEDFQPILEKKNPDLAKKLKEKFDAVQALLNKYKSGDTFVSYKTLTKDQIRELSDSIDALEEPLSQLTGVVVS